MEKHSLPMSDLADAEVLRKALDALAKRLDGKPAAARTAKRKVDLRRAVPAAPQDAYLAATRRATERAAPLLAEHGEPGPGLPELRALIAARYSHEGLATQPRQILVTSGARAALALLTAHFKPRVAAVETPTYFEALHMFRGTGARLIGCRVTTEGWDLDQLDAALAAARGQLAYLVPDFHNPTGALMSPRVRRTVAELATRYEVTVVVDETMRDLDLRDEPEPTPRIRRAILMGSASKAIWSDLRIGWIRASTALVAELSGHPLAGPLSPPPAQQLIAAELLGDLDQVLTRRRIELRRQRDYLCGLLDGDGRWHFTVPPGGLTLWLRLASARADAIVDRVREEGIDLAPGPFFAPDAALVHHLRVPYTPPLHVLDRVAAALDRACRG
ncbi:PLP-dependent aminotransferase family protein [Streptomyces sp. 8K308]|uniref:aminotransferase-like domain-containing protein n=1 Tax=Streptomyces sp. 8K308 TaxID=2530388 RepID=UPI0014051A6A|nr:PLP-dependent aminotransferase family protein [Streptomyces sp. 8K308]